MRPKVGKPEKLTRTLFRIWRPKAQKSIRRLGIASACIRQELIMFCRLEGMTMREIAETTSERGWYTCTCSSVIKVSLVMRDHYRAKFTELRKRHEHVALDQFKERNAPQGGYAT